MSEVDPNITFFLAYILCSHFLFPWSICVRIMIPIVVCPSPKTSRLFYVCAWQKQCLRIVLIVTAWSPSLHYQTSRTETAASVNSVLQSANRAPEETTTLLIPKLKNAEKAWGPSASLIPMMIPSNGIIHNKKPTSLSDNAWHFFPSTAER